MQRATGTAELRGMRSSATTAGRRSAAIARADDSPEPAGPRHLAPGPDDDVIDAALTERESITTGRHAEPEWSRELFDPRRDGDPFAWLGFAAGRDGAQPIRRVRAITGTSASNAWPRWLRASFSSGSSSAEVRVSPSGTKTGS